MANTCFVGSRNVVDALLRGCANTVDVGWKRGQFRKAQMLKTVGGWFMHDDDLCLFSSICREIGIKCALILMFYLSLNVRRRGKTK